IDGVDLREDKSYRLLFCNAFYNEFFASTGISNLCPAFSPKTFSPFRDEFHLLLGDKGSERCIIDKEDWFFLHCFQVYFARLDGHFNLSEELLPPFFGLHIGILRPGSGFCLAWKQGKNILYVKLLNHIFHFFCKVFNDSNAKLCQLTAISKPIIKLVVCQSEYHGRVV